MTKSLGAWSLMSPHKMNVFAMVCSNPCDSECFSENVHFILANNMQLMIKYDAHNLNAIFVVVHSDRSDTMRATSMRYQSEIFIIFLVASKASSFYQFLAGCDFRLLLRSGLPYKVRDTNAYFHV